MKSSKKDVALVVMLVLSLLCCLTALTTFALSDQIAVNESDQPNAKAPLKVDGDYVLTVTKLPFKLKIPGKAYEASMWIYPDDAEAYSSGDTLHVTKLGKKDSTFKAICFCVDFDKKTTETIVHSIVVRNGASETKEDTDEDDDEESDEDDADPTKVVSAVVFNETSETTVEQAKIINRIQSNRNPKFPVVVIDPDTENEKYKQLLKEADGKEVVYLDADGKIIDSSTLEELEKRLNK